MIRLEYALASDCHFDFDYLHIFSTIVPDVTS